MEFSSLLLVVVEHDARVLGPLDGHDEARILDETQPRRVRAHHGAEGVVRQRAHAALDLRVRDALHRAPRLVELDDRVRVAVLEDAVVLRAQVAVLAVGVVVDGAQRVREVHRREQIEGGGVAAAELLRHREPVAYARAHRALRLEHELQVAGHVVDEGVVSVHRERVAELVVAQVLGRRRRHLLSHHAPLGAAARVRVYRRRWRAP